MMPVKQFCFETGRTDFNATDAMFYSLFLFYSAECDWYVLVPFNINRIKCLSVP